MDRHSMTERIVAKMITDIHQEFREGHAETLHALLCLMLEDLPLRNIIDKYNSYEWEEV